VPSVRLVVVGASAGGVEALSRLVAALPEALPAAVLVVLHVAPGAPSVMPQILARAGALTARAVEDGETIRAGRIYVAPPDQHLVVDGGCVALVRGPRENGHRPAVDPLFRSAARAAGPGVIGVILSGNLSDGTHGLAQVKAHGGVTLVQEPDEAPYRGMPLSALAHVEIDHVLPIAALAATIVRLVHAELPVRDRSACEAAPDASHDDRTTHDRSEASRRSAAGPATDALLGGRVSAYTCPECRGTLREISDGRPARFRCRAGHSYDQSTLLHGKRAALGRALWTALAALEQNAAFARRIADCPAGRSADARREAVVERFRSRALRLDRRARAIRHVLSALPADAELPRPTEGTA
jgi:two-component system chemotaxis response regulator CheB